MPAMFLVLIALAAGQPPVKDDPRKSIEAGMLQCHHPDTTKKTCRSIATYTERPDGMFNNTAIVLLASQPLVVMKSVAPVSIESGAICGAVRRQDIDVAAISVEGVDLSNDKAAPIRAKIADSWAPIIDHRICTTYVVSGDSIVAKASIDGVAHPAMDQEVIWVAPTDGYRVAP